jgi:hypothetical protein
MFDFQGLVAIVTCASEVIDDADSLPALVARTLLGPDAKGRFAAQASKGPIQPRRKGSFCSTGVKTPSLQRSSSHLCRYNELDSHRTAAARNLTC